jgi:hypothetical protein
MHHRGFVCSTLLIAILYASCTCANLDCKADDFYGQFRIVRAADNADLVFGAQRIYDKDNIRFYALRGTDTTFFDYAPAAFGGVTPGDSILRVQFRPRSDTAYMRLSNGDVDTLALSFKTYGTKCCGTVTEITNFRWNNKEDLPGNSDTQLLKK